MIGILFGGFYFIGNCSKTVGKEGLIMLTCLLELRVEVLDFYFKEENTMQYRLAKSDDTKQILEIIKSTMKSYFLEYYSPMLIHSLYNTYKNEIEKDIEQGNVYVLSEDDKIIGTGAVKENSFHRVYVLPEYQKKGYGTYIINQLETEIAKKYDKVEIRALLTSTKFFLHRGYKKIIPILVDEEYGLILLGYYMEKPLSKTANLRLRPYKSCDAETIVSWIKDETALRKWSSDRYECYPINAEDINKKYLDCNGDCTEPDNFYPMTLLDNNEVVGHLIMRYTDKERQILRFGFVIVDDTKRGKGYGKNMLSLALKYAFEILKVNKVTLGVFENNESAYHCYKSAGFKKLREQSEEYYEISGQQWKCIEMEIINKKKGR